MDKNIILLGHGSGGRLSRDLLDRIIFPVLQPAGSGGHDDAAVLDLPTHRIALTTDSYVVDPIFFPGGSIGNIAVNGTVNDLAMMGARPHSLTVGLILEEGLAVSDLGRVLDDMKAAADAAGISIVAGDTKVVPRGKADKLFINTSGIGTIGHGLKLGGAMARHGDAIIVSGTIGDHGIAVLSAREGFDSGGIQTDSAPLADLVMKMIECAGDAIHVLRDPTRGGLATSIKEIAVQSSLNITLDESAIPLSLPVRGLCAMLGLDPLFIANEGKLICFAAEHAAETLLNVMHSCEAGKNAAVIGKVDTYGEGMVKMRTLIGGVRAVDMLTGEQLPRIC